MHQNYFCNSKQLQLTALEQLAEIGIPKIIGKQLLQFCKNRHTPPQMQNRKVSSLQGPKDVIILGEWDIEFINEKSRIIPTKVESRLCNFYLAKQELNAYNKFEAENQVMGSNNAENQVGAMYSFKKINPLVLFTNCHYPFFISILFNERGYIASAGANYRTTNTALRMESSGEIGKSGGLQNLLKQIDLPKLQFSNVHVGDSSNLALQCKLQLQILHESHYSTSRNNIFFQKKAFHYYSYLQTMTIGNPIECWITTADGSRKMVRQADLNFQKVTSSTPSSNYTIKFVDTVRYQTIDGFGASFTDSSSFLFMSKLSTSQRQTVFENLFSKTNGIGLSLIRQPAGACDFNRMDAVYSYCDTQNDWNLNSFSIDKDRQYILPCLKLAKSINPTVKFMVSPWSPPWWMKTTYNMNGRTNNQDSKLRGECYSVYAQYLCKIIQAFQAEGINFDSLTPQNEPLYAPTNYPGMSMNSGEQTEFIKNHLGPAMAQRQLKTKIICFDHNFDQMNYPMSVLNDQTARSYVAGSGFHPYTTAADHTVMTTLRNAHRDKELHLSEASGGTWVPQWYSAFMDQMAHMIRSTRNWCKSVVYWNMALDERGGPSLFNNTSSCRGVVTINSNSGAIDYNVDYYTLGMVSKFVATGAARIATNWWKDDLENVGFVNTDGSRVLVLCNRTGGAKNCRVQWGNKYVDYTIPANCCCTLKWEGTADTANVHLRSYFNQQFVCCDMFKTGNLLYANRSNPSTWETFTLAPLGNGQISITAQANGQICCAENYGYDPVQASRTTVGGTWETFELDFTNNGRFRLVSLSNSKVISVDSGNQQLYARSNDGSGNNETFDVVFPLTADSTASTPRTPAA